MKVEQQSLLFLHCSVLLFGGTALFSKLIGLPALDITVYRSGVAAIVLFILLTLQKKKITLDQPKDYGIAVFLGAIVGFHWVTYFASMQMAGITIGVIAFFTYPVITVFLEPLLNRTTGYKKPQLKDIAVAFIVLIGILLLIPEIHLGNQVTLGILSGIFSAFLFTLRNISHKHYFSHYSGPHAMLYQTLVAFLILVAFIEVPVIDIPSNDWLLILIVGVFFTAAPHALLATSLRHLSATTASLISCLQPLYASVLAFLLLNERVDIVSIIGGLLVISAALFETWSISKGR